MVKNRWNFTLSYCLLAFGIALTTEEVRAQTKSPVKLPTAGEQLDKMVSDFSPRIPPDVDPQLKKNLELQKKFAQVQLQFDIVSWQSFVALCWPSDGAGKPRPKISDPGEPMFDSYSTSEDIFDTPHTSIQAAKTARPKQNRQHIEKHKSSSIQVGDRVLSTISSVSGQLHLNNDEVAQAFAQPLWDQNGNMVRYEILVNAAERNYIVDNGLQTIAGQVKFSMAGNKVRFPAGVFGRSGAGAVEVKLGWKVLEATDDESRFLVADAIIMTGSPEKPKSVTVGLVGMHIAHKTTTSPQWIWSTFSHVDALKANGLETNPKTGQPRVPLFTNPSTETAPVNVPSASSAPYRDGLRPTQVLQLIPIPLATQQVNAKAQSALKSSKSVLQYYELLNTQWPTDPCAEPTPGGLGTTPESITNKSGGRPTPVYLINPLFETYFQKGNQDASSQEEGNPPDTTPIFGTESCMGCHSSAGVAWTGGAEPKYGGQLTGDFSWLLQKKAK